MVILDWKLSEMEYARHIRHFTEFSVSLNISYLILSANMGSEIEFARHKTHFPECSLFLVISCLVLSASMVFKYSQWSSQEHGLIYIELHSMKQYFFISFKNLNFKKMKLRVLHNWIYITNVCTILRILLYTPPLIDLLDFWPRQFNHW